jgi:hypothetical protein
LGFQTAKHGNFYTAVCTKVRNISSTNPKVNIFTDLQVSLNSNLIKDHVYDFTLYYSLADGLGIACNQLHVYFSSSQLNFLPTNNQLDPNFTYTNNLNFQVENDTLQFMVDTMNWVPLKGCFVAKGDENNLAIGNFRDGLLSKYIPVNRNTLFNELPGETDYDDFCYYYIDDLSLYDRGYYSGHANCRSDTSICFNSSHLIGNNIKDSSTYVWQPPTALSCTNCPNPVANPTVTTK